MKYVENYCRKKEIEFCVKQVDVAKQAKENGWSTEEAGRILSRSLILFLLYSSEKLLESV